MTEQTSYFGVGPSAPRSSVAGAWVDLNADFPPIEMAPGLEFRPVISGAMALNVVHFEPHTVAPVHAHEEEQISLVVEGELEFELDGEVRTLGPNMAVVIPPYVPHGARTHDTTCVAVDVFHPPRKALVEAMEARKRPPSS